jgi:hypothetical protein
MAGGHYVDPVGGAVGDECGTEIAAGWRPVIRYPGAPATGTMAPRPPHGAQLLTGARSPAAADLETASDEET